MKKGRFIRICIIAIITIVLLLVYIISTIEIENSKKSKSIEYKSVETEENITNAYYEVTSVDGDTLNILLTIENIKGIEKIISSDMNIECKGKEKIAIDKTLKEGEEYQLKLKLVGEDDEKLYTLVASTKPNIIVTNEDTFGDSTTKTIEIQYPDNKNLINYYSIDNEETWIEYVGEIDIVTVDDFKVSVKSIYKEGNTIPNIETQFIAKGNSLLSVIKDYVNSRALGKIYVKDEIYTVHTYVDNKDTIIEKDIIYGDARDIATETTDAQNMVILKVNGNLTINEGVTVGPYNSNYGGPKGFCLYCTETLTNNGVIHNNYGAKAAGQNVYLWKNENVGDDINGIGGQYEYVPELGSNGATSTLTSTQNYQVVKPLVTNAQGVGRKLAGGASGAAAKIGWKVQIKGGNGGQGTSYSGGGGRPED